MSSPSFAVDPSPTFAFDPRVTIFLSHSTQDLGVVESLLAHVEGDGIKFSVAPRDIPPQQDWAAVLQQQIRCANLFLLLYTSAASQSGEVQKEVHEAIQAGKEIWVIKDPAARVTDFYEACDFMKQQAYVLHQGDEQACFNALRADIKRRWPSPDHAFLGEVRIDNCPYPGPTPFKREFANRFFGRGTALNALKTGILGHKRVLLVYGPSGVGKTSLLTVGLSRELPPYCFYSGPTNEASTSGLLRSILTRLLDQDTSDLPSIPLNETVTKIVGTIQQGPQSKYVLCFDQMENFFAENTSRDEINRFLESIENILAHASGKAITVLISFRKESLADVQPHIRRMFRDDWDERIIRKLSAEDAKNCIIEPARCEGVQLDAELVSALVKALEKDQGGGEPVVDLMDIQKVSKSLWLQVANTEVRHSRIDANTLAHLLKSDADLQTNASLFVAKVLTGYMHEAIERIAKYLPEGTAGKDGAEYVTLSLLEFVGPAKERLRVRATIAGNGERAVGRLPLNVVKKLVNSGLVQPCGEWEYELAHDALAVEIGEYGERRESVFAVKSLDSLLKRESKFKDSQKGSFNQNSDLLAKLEAVRENNWHFVPEEAEFLVRWALGDQRRNVKGATISLDAWTRILAKASPNRLVQVLKDGLSDDSEESVQLDIMNLLHKEDIRALLDPGAQKLLGTRLRDLSLTCPNHQVRAKACSALVALNYEPGIQGLFASFGDPETRVKARNAISMLRHAFDTLNAAGDCFPRQWARLSLWPRVSVLNALCGWRWRHSYERILFMMAVAVPFTALGAILPFMVLGLKGASLTWGTDYSVPAGVFQGASGGLVWGLGVTTALLIYCVIWRGGRIRQRALETVGMAVWGTVGGFLGGLVNAVVITCVFVPDGLVRQGWLSEPLASKKEALYQAFFPHVAHVTGTPTTAPTFFGWTTTIFGACLGIGIGWSLAYILADPNERWIPRLGSSASGKNKEILFTIARHVLLQSWRNILWIAIGAALIVYVIHPGPGTCDHATKLVPQSLAQTVCKDSHGNWLPELPPIWLRTAGLGLVILGGSLAQEIAFLFGLFSLQVGVNLKESPYFLRSAHAAEAISEIHRTNAS
jgi:hypothetical protein